MSEELPYPQYLTLFSLDDGQVLALCRTDPDLARYGWEILTDDERREVVVTGIGLSGAAAILGGDGGYDLVEPIAFEGPDGEELEPRSILAVSSRRSNGSSRAGLRAHRWRASPGNRPR